MLTSLNITLMCFLSFLVFPEWWFINKIFDVIPQKEIAWRLLTMCINIIFVTHTSNPALSDSKKVPWKTFIYFHTSLIKT